MYFSYTLPRNCRRDWGKDTRQVYTKGRQTMADFIPAQDPQALIWLQTFASGIQANPALYMLTGPDSAAISAAVAAFAAALAVTSVPATKTAVTVAAKDDARTAAEQICRQFAALIK